MKKVLLLFALSIIYFQSISIVQATDVMEEQSEPYVSLLVEELFLKPKDQIVFTIVYGNRGTESAKNVKITLNQPLDSRSALSFLSSDPQPDKWLTNEYGNLAEFHFDELEVDKADDEAKEILLIAQVRESIPSQTITPTVSLQAPNRPLGKRLVMSDSVFIQIKNPKSETVDQVKVAGLATASSFNETVTKAKSNNSEKKVIDIEPVQQSVQWLTDVESRTSLLSYIILILIIVLAFYAGRKSKHIHPKT